VVGAVIGGRGIVVRKASAASEAEELGFGVAGGQRSSNSSSLMGDEGSGVDGVGGISGM